MSHAAIHKQTVLIISASGLLLGLLTGLTSLEQSISVVIILAMVVACFYSIRLGILLLILSSAVVASQFPLFTYRFAHFHLAHLLCLVLLLADGFRRITDGCESEPQRSADTPMILYIIVAAISILNSYMAWAPDVPTRHRHLIVQAAGIALIVFSYGILKVTYTRVRSHYWNNLLYFSLIASGLLFPVIGSIFQILRSQSTLGAEIPLDIGVIYTIGFALTFSELIHTEKPVARALWASAALVFVAAVVNSGFGSGARYLIAVSVAGVTVGALRSRKAALIITLVLVAAGLLVVFGDAFGMFRELKSISLKYRLIIWQDTFRVLNQHWSFWLIGVGPGNYYAYSLIHTFNATSGGAWGLTTPHSQYFSTLGETGLLGFGLLIWFIVNITKRLWATIQASENMASRAAYVGSLGAFLGVLSASIFSDSLIPSISDMGFDAICTTIYTWILIGLVFSKARLDQKDPPNEST